ncbi:uncharacterized protein [Nicotiana sylvestris]|uniref:uncharacterized protein n=1 Tax=Nicotiana sylvestris TaxID=4096 RepID=UPI00388CA53E
MAIDMNVQEFLVIGNLDLLIHQVREEWATKNFKIPPYLHHVQELRKRSTNMEFQHVPRVKNEFADALATLSSMIQHLEKNFIDPILVKIHDQPAYCAHIEEEANGKPCGGILYRRTPDLGLLRCVGTREASKLPEKIHAGTCGPHMNGFVLAKKILREGKPASNGHPGRSDPAPVPTAISNLNNSHKPSTHPVLDITSVLEKSPTAYSADGF